MIWVNELTASKGPLANDTQITYKRDADTLSLEIPQDFEQFAPQQKGMEYEVLVHERIGGVLLYYPLATAKCDDI